MMTWLDHHCTRADDYPEDEVERQLDPRTLDEIVAHLDLVEIGMYS